VPLNRAPNHREFRTVFKSRGFREAKGAGGGCFLECQCETGYRKHVANADSHFEPLRPLKKTVQPAVSVDQMVAIGVVLLSAGDIPNGILREFYERVIGLVYVAADRDTIQFRHQQRSITLDRKRQELGHVGLLIRGFDDALVRLRAKNINVELLHTNNGLTRMCIARDPAGNFVHLLETRYF
jgi:hypothetical protein